MDQSFFHRLKYRQSGDQFFARVAGMVMLLFLLLHSPLGARPNNSVFKDTLEIRAAVLLQQPIPLYPVKAKEDSLQGKIQPQKEKTFPLWTCGTVGENKKPGHYWLLVTSAISFLIMLLLIIRDRKPVGRE